jgi:UDP-galactopyranose mutase
MKRNKILIVGAGFSGATIARLLAEANLQITVIEKRSHIAGNAYDYTNDIGIREHKYGPHIFHTNNEKVFTFLSRFTEWSAYKHKVKAILPNGEYVTLPVNRATANIVGKENIIEIFFRPYTKKMWGIDVEEIDPDVLNRVSIRDDDNEYYFPTDAYQFMPTDGYTELIRKMLDHPSITIKTDMPFDKSMENDFDFIFNSMPIDEYFSYQFGELPYRSIKFHTVTLPNPFILPTATVNFTHTGPYTRITEWKHFPNHGNNACFTTLTYEEPCDYKDNDFERYYPVKDIKGINRELFRKYAALTPKNMIFIGRCGKYAYLDMHQAVSSSMAIAADFIPLSNNSMDIVLQI